MGGCLSVPLEQDHQAVGGHHSSFHADADDAVAALLESSSLGTRIQLFLRCDQLANLDTGRNNKSDPFVVVLAKDAATGQLRELGRTEVVVNSLGPTFIRTVHLTYKFEEVQRLVFRVYDCDTFGGAHGPNNGFDNSASEKIDVSKQDFIGQAECDLAAIMGSYGQHKTLTLTHGTATNRGTLTVRGEELPHQNAAVRMELAASDLPKKGAAPSVFLVLERVQEAPGGVLYTPVYRTEVLARTTSPQWKPFEVGVQQLCLANFAQHIRIRIYAWQKGGNHMLLAQAESTLDALLATAQHQTDKTLKLGPPTSAANGKGGNGASAAAAAGVLLLKSAHLIARPSFVDYVRGGCQINFNVAIDFTASNGDPSHPQSLHFIPPYHDGGNGNGNGGGPTAPSALYHATNPYTQAILAVGQVLEHYDSDRTFPAFGFGAKIGHYTSHCFALNGDDAHPEVVGIDGVLQAYQRAIRMYELAGPTYFQEVIARAAASATHCTQREQSYQVLLIITDGIINDMDATVSSIVQASTLPLSILIVGVGNADFSAMQTLDGDETRLSNASGTARRDIVQFVELKEFVDARTGAIDRARLARALLDEIPGQLLSYMGMQGVPPNPPRGNSIA